MSPTSPESKSSGSQKPPTVSLSSQSKPTESSKANAKSASKKPNESDVAVKRPRATAKQFTAVPFPQVDSPLGRWMDETPIDQPWNNVAAVASKSSSKTGGKADNAASAPGATAATKSK